MSELVTIVVPFFNRAKLVTNTISNIFEQSCDKWELIIVDDGSDDAEFEIVRSYVSNNPCTSLIKRPETWVKGAQTCRNIGLEMARGKYIIFFDSDDYIPPYCLEQRVSYMEGHPELDFAVFPYAEYESDPRNPEVIGGLRFYKDDLRAFVSRTLPFMVWSNIYKTDSLRKKNIYWDTNLKSLQDAHFNVLALCAGLNYDYGETCQIDYYNRTAYKGASISKGVYSPDRFDSHIYYFNSVKDAVSNKKGMKGPLRQGFLYIYSLMMDSYSREHSIKLIKCLSEDKTFFIIATIKDFLYRTVLRRLSVSANTSRWLLFPNQSFRRKRILKQQRNYCAMNAVRQQDLKVN